MSAQPALDWARSGLMGLTGPSSAAPLVPGFDAAGAIGALLEEFARVAGRDGCSLGLDFHLMTERARLLRLARGGQASCNRSCRMLETRDGWIALNLPRPADAEMMLPWLGVATGFGDPWNAVAAAVARRDRDELLASSTGLAIAVAPVPGIVAAAARPADPASDSVIWPVPDAALDASAGRPPDAPPLVVDLSSLWAGPLCGQLLARAGARVIKVESPLRPETMRRTAPAMFDRLNGGKQSVVLDFGRDGDHAVLRALLARADIVIGSARPRAFVQFGLEPQAFLARNPRLAWIAITAHGWHGDAGLRVGFGDDAAAAAGLVAYDAAGRPNFVGDALADPLTGIAAATLALDAWRRGAGGLYDVSLSASAARIAAAPRLGPEALGSTTQRDGAWWVEVGAARQRVAAPGWRRCAARATRFGADTARIREEFN